MNSTGSFRNINRLIASALLGLALVLSTPVSGATVVGVVSERSAAEMAAGAERFLTGNPDHRVVLRTPEQLASLDNRALNELIGRADALLLAAVFGDQVGRLERVVREQAADRLFPILAVNGDRTLTRLSRLEGLEVLGGLDAFALNDLMKAPDPGADVEAHRAGLRQQFPQQIPWLEGRALYQGRTPNIWMACCAGCWRRQVTT